MLPYVYHFTFYLFFLCNIFVRHFFVGSFVEWCCSWTYFTEKVQLSCLSCGKPSSQLPHFYFGYLINALLQR